MGVLAVMCVIVPILLGLAFSGASATASVKRERRDSYVAVSAIDAAIQHARSAEWVGRFGIDCPALALVVDDVSSVVECTSDTGAFDLDRTLSFTAKVDGSIRASADVIIRDGSAGAGEPSVDVLAWDSDHRSA
jgi:hypothetical protein